MGQLDRSQSAPKERQSVIDKTSTERQPVINQASTERLRIINETSTERQIDDFLDENRRMRFLGDHQRNAQRGLVDRKAVSDFPGAPIWLDRTINSTDARAIVPRGLLDGGLQDAIDANATVRSVARWDAFPPSVLRSASMAGSNGDEDDERNQSERSRLRFVLRTVQLLACSACNGTLDAMTAPKDVLGGKDQPRRSSSR